MKEQIQYAIVDIETTGGYAAGSGITEVAILIHDGEKVIERYETLINPYRAIPFSIQMLTGISNEMVANSPGFSDVAPRIFELLSGRIFVAHNVNFDYSFLKYYLEQAQFNLTTPKLCTVRLSRKLLPGYKSYSLGRLCDSLKIPLVNNHRAGGDADATAILFDMLLAKDTEGVIDGMLKRNSKDQVLPPNLPKEQFEHLPQQAGVYYFHDQNGKIVYVGKATNIKKRITSHFSGTNPLPQRQNFLRSIYSISTEICGTELMSLLLEAIEIKKHWPAFNRALKNREQSFGLYAYEDLNGYLRLVVGKEDKSRTAIHSFSQELQARNLLHKLVRTFNLCPELCKLGTCDAHGETKSLIDEIMQQDCIADQGPELYNVQVQQALDRIPKYLPSFMIRDKGRHTGEQSCIWMEYGNFYGMGYIDNNISIGHSEEIKMMLTQYKSNHYMNQLIYTYAEKHPEKVSMLLPVEAYEMDQDI